jgi:hypothetical protein
MNANVKRTLLDMCMTRSINTFEREMPPQECLSYSLGVEDTGRLEDLKFDRFRARLQELFRGLLQIIIVSYGVDTRAGAEAPGFSLDCKCSTSQPRPLLTLRG